jgi:hypothetical protein
LKWCEAALFGCHEIYASFPWARPSHNTRVPFLSRFTAAHYNLRIVELFIVSKKKCL